MGVIYLVRHGQASFGTDDYDRLSSNGERQAELLGTALAAAGVQPAPVVAGSMKRQRRTAEAIVAVAGWGQEVDVDPDWDEFDHLALASTHPTQGTSTDPRAFQASLEAGMREWADGVDDGPESFAAFCARTRAALDRASGPSRGGTALVVTSAGVISSLATELLGGGVEQWIRLNRVCVNTGVTKVVRGSRGLSLVSFNSHDHLGRGHVSYR